MYTESGILIVNGVAYAQWVRTVSAVISQLAVNVGVRHRLHKTRRPCLLVASEVWVKTNEAPGENTEKVLLAQPVSATGVRCSNGTLPR